MSAKRCAAIAPDGHHMAGAQCGGVEGHQGPHTSLVGSEFMRRPEPVMLAPDALCTRCGYAPVAHTGPEMFCPIYATYRAQGVPS